MSDDQEYITTNIGLAGFFLFLDNSSFLGAEQHQPGKGVRFVFRDTATDGMSCAVLEKAFFSKESVQLRNAREYAMCIKTVSDCLKEAYKAEGERVKL